MTGCGASPRCTTSKTSRAKSIRNGRGSCPADTCAASHPGVRPALRTIHHLSRSLPGDGSLVPNYTYSLTLTLDGSAGNGDLEQGQVEQAKAAAAEAQGARTGADAVGSGGERANAYMAGGPRPVRAAAGMRLGTAVVGECSFRAANLPAGDAAWGGNDAAAGTLLVNPCNGPGQYLVCPIRRTRRRVIPPPPRRPLRRRRRIRRCWRSRRMAS